MRFFYKNKFLFLLIFLPLIIFFEDLGAVEGNKKAQAVFWNHFTLDFYSYGGFTADGMDFKNGSFEELIFGTKLELPFLQAKYFQKDKKINWGISAFSSKYLVRFPFGLKAGNLSAGGGLSRLNSPSFSAPSTPFTSLSTQALPVKISLPTYSSFSKAPSYFLNAGYSDKNSVFQKGEINFWLVPEEQNLTCALSLFTKLAFTKSFGLTFSSISGFFPYKEQTDSSWYNLQKRYYHAGTDFCTSMQLGMKLQDFSSIFILNVYETPLSDWSFTFRNENSFKAGNFTFSFCEFLNPNQNLITSSQRIIEEQLQLKGGVSFQTVKGLKNPLFIKAGFTAYSKLHLYGGDNSFKYTAGARIALKKYTTSLYGSLSHTIGEENQLSLEAVSVQSKNTVFAKDFKIDLNGTFSYLPKTSTEWSTNEKLSANISYTKNPNITWGNNITLEQKNGEQESVNYTTSLAAKFNIKSISVTGKFTLKM